MLIKQQNTFRNDLRTFLLQGLMLKLASFNWWGHWALGARWSQLLKFQSNEESRFPKLALTAQSREKMASFLTPVALWNTMCSWWKGLNCIEMEKDLKLPGKREAMCTVNSFTVWCSSFQHGCYHPVVFAYIHAMCMRIEDQNLRCYIL